MTIEEIRAAVARGYCTKENEKKILDPELCFAIANEIKQLVDNDFDKYKLTRKPIYKLAELTSKGKPLPLELDLDTYITIDGPGHYEIERSEDGEYHWIHYWELDREQSEKSMEDCVLAIIHRKNRLRGLLVEL